MRTIINFNDIKKKEKKARESDTIKRERKGNVSFESPNWVDVSKMYAL